MIQQTSGFLTGNIEKEQWHEMVELTKEQCHFAPDVFRKKGIFKNFAKFTGKHLCQSLFNKVDSDRDSGDSGTGVFLCILRHFGQH